MAIQIGEVYSGHWNDWQQASRLNSSFGYGSPTNLGAIGMGAIGIAGDPYLAQGTLQSPQGFPNLGAIGIAGDPYEAQGTLQSPPGYPNLGAIGMGMLGGADLPQAGPSTKVYSTQRQAAMAREKMGLSTSRSAREGVRKDYAAAMARERKEAHSCRIKLRRLTAQYHAQERALISTRGDRDSARRTVARLHHRINALTRQLAGCEQRAAHFRHLLGAERRRNR